MDIGDVFSFSALNNTATNIRIHVFSFTRAHISVGFEPRSRISRFSSICTFSCFSCNAKQFSKVIVWISTLTSSLGEFPLPYVF